MGVQTSIFVNPKQTQELGTLRTFFDGWVQYRVKSFERTRCAAHGCCSCCYKFDSIVSITLCCLFVCLFCFLVFIRLRISAYASWHRMSQR